MMEMLTNYGTLGVFILSFIEAIFFPIPPETLLIPSIIANPNNLTYSVLFCTLGSALGALVGHRIGYVGGKKVLLKYFQKERIDKATDLFIKYDVWAIAIAALTPIPYKVFTILSGVFNMDIYKLFSVSIITRGLRFLLVGYLALIYGDRALQYIHSAKFNIVILSIFFVAIMWYYMYLRSLKKKNEKHGLRK